MNFLAWTALCAASMAVMLLFAGNKTIVIADGYREQTSIAVTAETPENAPEAARQNRELLFGQTEGMSGRFNIPLPRNVKAENVVVENHYMSRELWVYIQCEDTAYYEENALWGDVSEVESGSFELQNDGLLLKLRMDRILEYKTTMDGSVLTIAVSEPHETYAFTVVLDPEGGGVDRGAAGGETEEKELTLQVAKLVQKKLALPDVRLYLTRNEDTEVSEQERLWLTEEVKADLYIRIGAEYDGENPENYGIQSSYNDEYYLPGFGNVNLADVVTKEVTIAAGNRALGLYSAPEDSILKAVRTCGTRISLGYLSNPTESVLLSQETYREKLADGIVAAIGEACEELRAQEEH